MRLSIDHTLHYEYSQPVFMEPMTVRLEPASGATQTCERFTLDASPAPRGITRFDDVSGHAAHMLWFEGRQSSLELRARSVVRTLRQNPFDFILADHASERLPLAYAPATMAALAAELRPSVPDCDRLSRYVALAQHDSSSQTIAFLCLLCAQLQSEVKLEVRPEGDPWPACRTLTQKAGSCRDVAMVMIEACRRAGIASRFVSGYRYIPEEDSGAAHEPDLHAWVEVYLPGGGWRGFDPTMGLAVADHHVVLAAAHLPELAAPTRGTFRGTGVTSTLTARLTLRPLA